MARPGDRAIGGGRIRHRAGHAHRRAAGLARAAIPRPDGGGRTAAGACSLATAATTASIRPNCTPPSTGWWGPWPGTSAAIRTSSAGRSTTNTTGCATATGADLFQDFLRGHTAPSRHSTATGPRAYWSQTYSAWRSASPTHRSCPAAACTTPALMLDLKRFITDSYRKFQRSRSTCCARSFGPRPGSPTTSWAGSTASTIMMLSADLDFVSWDWYVGIGHHDYSASGAAHDLTRGFKRQQFLGDGNPARQCQLGADQQRPQ